MIFSERHGYVPVKSMLQTGGVDVALRNRLWNLISSILFWDVPPYPTINDFLPNLTDPHAIFKSLWHNHYKATTDGIGASYFTAFQKFKTRFDGATWFRVYDLVEFLATDHSTKNKWQHFRDSVNKVLKDEVAGYRFVSDRIVEITSDEEIASIEAALASREPLGPVVNHLRQALILMADRQSPDYRNSIKESISAIEALCKLLTGLPKGTLGPAIRALESRTELHPALKDAFEKLYGFTSDAEGIRHALVEQPNLDAEDAKFMLVSCSAFVNYAVIKAQKAGIKV